MTDLPKLVRDRIPEMPRANGDDPAVHVADVLEVVAAIRDHRGIDADGLARMRAAKADGRGGFAAGSVLEAVED